MNIINPLLGGVFIGLASSFLLWSLGQITGISGITSNALLKRPNRESLWRYFFLFGLLIGGLSLFTFYPEYFKYSYQSNYYVLILGGLLVGFGTRLGRGCTSGHGVCGLPRFSPRSLVATLTFIISGMLTVYLMRVL